MRLTHERRGETSQLSSTAIVCVCLPAVGRRAPSAWDGFYTSTPESFILNDDHYYDQGHASGARRKEPPLNRMLREVRTANGRTRLVARGASRLLLPSPHSDGERSCHACVREHPLYGSFLANLWDVRERVVPLRMDTLDGVAHLQARRLGRARRAARASRDGAAHGRRLASPLRRRRLASPLRHRRLASPLSHLAMVRRMRARLSHHRGA